MRPRSRFRPAAALLAAAATSFVLAPAHAHPHDPAPQPGAQPVVLPDTPAARVARGFLDMLADGTEKAVAGFENAHASTSRRGSVELAERARRVEAMRREWGTLTIERVTRSSDSGITLGVRSSGGQWLEMEFQLSAAEPGRLDAIVITSEGQRNAPKPQPVTPDRVAEVVEAAATELEKSYVFPDVARKMGESVRAKLKAGEYDSIKDELELAQRLTDDFRAVSNDKHLRVRLAPERPGASPMMGPDPEEVRRENYGFRKVELLPGNIGYLRFDIFMDDDEARRLATNSMSFLANADAIIFDMRFNGGGSPQLIRYITSYLFEEPTHLNSMIDRDGSVVEEYWTLEDVPGKRPAAGVPVFVLTSSRTFSGAEEFSYNLKNLNRAAIIGETTGGGAHPVRAERLDARFVIGIPYMRAHNPVSRTNWEGSGVEPDIKVPAAEALERATAEAHKAIEQRRSAQAENK